MTNSMRLRLHSNKSHNRNMMIALSVAILIHLIVGIGIRTLGNQDSSNIFLKREYDKISTIEIENRKPVEPIKPKVRRKIEVKPVVTQKHAIPRVDPNIIETGSTYFEPPSMGSPETSNVMTPPDSETATGQVSPVEILHKETPRYPAFALRNGIQGVTELKLVIGPDGEIKNIEVICSSKSDKLDNAAIRAARKCTFKPAVNNGVQIESTVKLKYLFIIIEDEYVIEDSFEINK